jgi:hypothetical protein
MSSSASFPVRVEGRLDPPLSRWLGPTDPAAHPPLPAPEPAPSQPGAVS